MSSGMVGHGSRCSSTAARLLSSPVGEVLDMHGRVVLVTGGGRGVGRGITERFLEAGATVVICGRSEPAAVADPAAGSARAVFVAADVREADQVDALVTGMVERYGRLDVVVNNAGGAPPAEAATASPRFS